MVIGAIECQVLHLMTPLGGNGLVYLVISLRNRVTNLAKGDSPLSQECSTRESPRKLLLK